MSEVSLVVAAHNTPPAVGGVERLVGGLCRHIAPGSTVLVKTAPGRVPPRWRTASRKISAAPSSAATLCVEWWPEARALAAANRDGLRACLAHGTEISTGLVRPRVLRALRRSLAAADVVIADSDFTADLCSQIGIATSVVHPGVELGDVASAASARELARALDLTDRRVVVTVARLVPRKGHLALLRRWHRVLSAVPDAVWVIAGDGPERALLETIAPPSVRFLGRVVDETVAALYRLADVHVMPGLTVAGHVEGFGLAAVEAAAAGTPTLATATGGIREAISDGGLVFGESDHDALVDGLIEVLSSTGRLAALSENATLHAKSLAWPTVAQRYRQVLGLTASREQPA